MVWVEHIANILYKVRHCQQLVAAPFLNSFPLKLFHMVSKESSLHHSAEFSISNRLIFLSRKISNTKISLMTTQNTEHTGKLRNRWM